MTTPINVGDLIPAIVAAASGVIHKDVTAITGFSADQARRIETLSITLANLIAAGAFQGDPQSQADHLGILEDLIKNFARTLKGLTVITVEKVINAVVKTVWDALDRATGLALPRP